MGGASKQTSSVKIWQCHSGKLSCDDLSFSLAYSISKLAMPPRLLESSTAVAVNLISLLPTANADITTPRLRLLLFLLLKHFSLLIYVKLLLLQHQLQCLLTPPRYRSQVSILDSLRCLQSCYSSTSTCYPFLNMLPTSSAVTVPASDICICSYIYRQHRALCNCFSICCTVIRRR